MHELELILALLVAVTGLAIGARKLHLPYPILMLIGGLVLAAIPAVPNVVLAPEVVFLIFLPPLLYIAGFETSIREVRAQKNAIVSLALGLVLATIAVVAVVANQLLPQIGWPIAFALGAIVAPPDAVAATALLRNLGVPRRVVTLLEGESLFNDATALVAYQAALAAAATQFFSPTDAVLRFLLAAVGGVVLGLVIGTAVAWLRQHLSDPAIEITVSLLTPFAAYLPAERLGVSGVLATVTTGLCIGLVSPSVSDSETRLRSRAVWDMVVFILNGLVFILIGLQLSTILEGLSGRSLAIQIGVAAVITLAVIGVRLLWVFGSAWIDRVRDRVLHSHHPDYTFGETFVVSWAGMRGVVSLATALALPLDTPGRDVLIFVTFCVILATLVGQGLTLAPIIRALHVTSLNGSQADCDELRARTAAVEAAVARIEELAGEWPTHLPLIDTLRAQYSHRATHFAELAPGPDGDGPNDDGAAEQELIEHRKIRRAVIDAERGALLDLRRQGEIDDQALRRIERDLDLEELRLEA